MSKRDTFFCIIDPIFIKITMFRRKYGGKELLQQPPPCLRLHSMTPPRFAHSGTVSLCFFPPKRFDCTQPHPERWVLMYDENVVIECIIKSRYLQLFIIPNVFKVFIIPNEVFIKSRYLYLFIVPNVFEVYIIPNVFKVFIIPIFYLLFSTKEKLCI
jgi:hypothetical protein